MSGRRAAAGLLLAAMAVACGARDQVELIHPREDDGALAVVAVDYTRMLTAPDNFVLRPDEFGGAAVDSEHGLVYMGSRDGFLFELDATDGSVRWDLSLGGAVSGVPVLVPAQGPDDEAMLLVGTDNGVLHAIGLSDRKTRWSYETPGRIRNAPVVHQGVVFFVNSRDQIYALDLRTGSWRWQYEQELQTVFTVHGHAGLSFVPSADQGVELGTLLSCFDNGKVVALAASSGQALWISSVAPPAGGDFVDCDSTPLVDAEDGAVFVAGQSTGVYALDLGEGTERWRFPIRAAQSLAMASDGALVGSSSLEGVFVLERDGSRLRWRSPLAPGVVSPAVVVDDIVFVGHSAVGLVAFDVGTGQLAAQLRTGSGMSGVPVYDPQHQRLFAMSNRGMFVSLRVGEAVEQPWTASAR